MLIELPILDNPNIVWWGLETCRKALKSPTEHINDIDRHYACKISSERRHAFKFFLFEHISEKPQISGEAYLVMRLETIGGEW